MPENEEDGRRARLVDFGTRPGLDGDARQWGMALVVGEEVVAAKKELAMAKKMDSTLASSLQG